MAEYQVTYWRDVPTMVAAREGDQVVKSPLTNRFQEAIDEAAMRLGETSSEDYLAGWVRGEWTALDGDPVEVADVVVAQLEEAWPDDRLADYVDAIGAASRSS